MTRHGLIRSGTSPRADQAYRRCVRRDLASREFKLNCLHWRANGERCSSYTLRLLTRHAESILCEDSEGNMFPRLYNIAPWSPVLTGDEAYFQPLNLIPTPLIKIQHQVVSHSFHHHRKPGRFGQPLRRSLLSSQPCSTSAKSLKAPICSSRTPAVVYPGRLAASLNDRLKRRAQSVGRRGSLSIGKKGRGM